VNDLAQLLAVLRSRRSIRAFLPKAPPKALIESIIEAATTRPQRATSSLGASSWCKIAL